MVYVIKRLKNKEEFNASKIEVAIKKAFFSCNKGIDKNHFDKIMQRILSSIEILGQEEINIETIQDIIEETLMRFCYYDVAKSFILYREKHKNIRNNVERNLQFIDNFIKSDNTANATIDDNSNVSTHNIAVMNTEIHKEDNKETNIRIWYNKIKELYGKELAEQFIVDLNTICYAHDLSSQIGMPYCVAISLYPFLLNGIKDIGGLSAAPKNIDSFCGLFINLVFSIASQYKGAVATPGVLLCMDYFLRKEWGDDYYIKNDVIISSDHCLRKMTIKSQIHQYFQQICYSLMQPSGSRGNQACFWNLSIFDKPFFDTMYGDFYFPDGTRPKWESLSWLQKDFMHWLNQERLKCILTFPVVSLCLIYQDHKFLDEDLYQFAAQEYSEGDSFFTYISDSADSLSSCCFDGYTRCSFRESEDDIDMITYFHDAYKKYKDKIIYVLNPETEKYHPAKVIKRKTNDLIIFSIGGIPERTIKCTKDHIFPVFDTLTHEYVEKYAKDIKITDRFTVYHFVNETIENIRYVKAEDCDCFCFQYIEDLEKPYFVLPDSNIITHNCRLSSKISKPQFNFTNGQLSEMTGSKNVITLNLNRIIQDWCKSIGGVPTVGNQHDSLKFYLINILERVYKYQIAYNEILKYLHKNDLLTVYNAGFIDMKKQYLTIGINGLNQAAEYLGMKCNKNKEYEDFCSFIFSTIKEQNTLHKTDDCMFNTEFVPAESAAIKLYNRDKKDGYWVPNDTNLYASYIFKPNDPNISVLDKLYLHGNSVCGDNLDGGSAAHIGLDSHLSKEQYLKIIKYAAEVGCKYFTFNVPNSECDDCGYITKVPIKECPKCGSKNISYYDRVIGYLTKIKNWSKGRQIEQKTRVYSKNIE